MATRGKVKEPAGELIKNLDNLTKPPCFLIPHFVFSVIIMCSVNLSKIAIAMDTDCMKGSNYRRLQRFVSQINWCHTNLIPFILKVINLNKDLTLLIDRTNWQFVSKKINILTVCVLYEGYGIPLVWSLLNKKGNSNQGERMDLIQSLINVIGKDKIKTIIADREFRGPVWYKYMIDNGIDFVIRVTKVQKVNDKGQLKSVVKIIESNTRKGRYSDQKEYEYHGCKVYVSGFKFRNDKGKLEYLILLSSHKLDEVTKVYGERWQIKSMFRNMKSNGFNLEDAHIVDDDRLHTLIGLIAIAYTWTIKVGF
jgi:hypothetical protein